MSSAEYVEDATEWAKALVLSDQRAAGDYGNAMRRVARRVGVPFSVIWNLHYRPPKAVDAKAFEKLGTSFADEQRRLYRAERAAYTPHTALGRLLMRAADFLADENSGAVKDD